MCNLYSIRPSRSQLVRYFQVSDNRTVQMMPMPAIFPSYNAPVVRVADDGEREIVMMSWGFVFLQKGKAPRRVTNVRDDKIQASRFWVGSFEERRCLVPATSFCEPN